MLMLQPLLIFSRRPVPSLIASPSAARRTAFPWIHRQLPQNVHSSRSSKSPICGSGQQRMHMIPFPCPLLLLPRSSFAQEVTSSSRLLIAVMRSGERGHKRHVWEKRQRRDRVSEAKRTATPETALQPHSDTRRRGQKRIWEGIERYGNRQCREGEKDWLQSVTTGRVVTFCLSPFPFTLPLRVLPDSRDSSLNPCADDDRSLIPSFLPDSALPDFLCPPLTSLSSS